MITLGGEGGGAGAHHSGLVPLVGEALEHLADARGDPVQGGEEGLGDDGDAHPSHGAPRGASCPTRRAG